MIVVMLTVVRAISYSIYDMENKYFSAQERPSRF